MSASVGGFSARAAAWVVTLALIASCAPDTRGGGASESAPVTPVAGTPVALPMTIQRVWYRTLKETGGSGKRHTADLVISDDALTFAGSKRTLLLPLKSVRFVALGKLRGDLDTDWVMLQVEHPGISQFVAVRDGRRFGYGARTGTIYDQLRQVLRQTHSGPYDTPAGWVAYDGLDHQFTLMVPEGWSYYHQQIVVVDDLPMLGTTVFSAEPIAEAVPIRGGRHEGRHIDLNTRQFSVHRRDAQPGMPCDGFKPGGRKEVLAWVAEDPLFRAAFEPAGELEVEEIPLGWCIGLEVHGSSVRREDGTRAVLDARVVSDGRTVFLFVLRSWQADYEARLEIFDRVVDSVGLANQH